jgi:hypothetical protein
MQLLPAKGKPDSVVEISLDSIRLYREISKRLTLPDGGLPVFEGN